MLEKRVKSRFSHRYLHVIPVTAPRVTDASVSAVSHADIDDSDAAASYHSCFFHRYCLLATNLLIINEASLHNLMSKVQPSDRTKFSDSVAQWNAHVKAFFEDDLVKNCLRQTWEVTMCIRKLRNIMVSSALLISHHKS